MSNSSTENTNPQRKGADDVVVRVDKETAEQIKLLSETMDSSIKETTRWVTWLARKCMGRKISIEDGPEVLEILLTEFNKVTDLTSKRGRKT